MLNYVGSRLVLDCECVWKVQRQNMIQSRQYHGNYLTEFEFGLLQLLFTPGECID